MRLDGCHLSPADHACRDICSPGEMRSLVAFHRPAVISVSLIAVELSTFTHLLQRPLTEHELVLSSFHLLGRYTTYHFHCCALLLLQLIGYHECFTYYDGR